MKPTLHIITGLQMNERLDFDLSCKRSGAGVGLTVVADSCVRLTVVADVVGYPTVVLWEVPKLWKLPLS